MTRLKATKEQKYWRTDVTVSSPQCANTLIFEDQLYPGNRALYEDLVSKPGDIFENPRIAAE
jgi:hypothetical protein